MTALDTRTALAVSEVFGPTVQGEGPSLGRRCAFVRLGGCNLTCSWCDTPFTWDNSRYNLRDEINYRSADDIYREVRAMGVTRVVISGGEPLLHQHRTAWALMVNSFRLADLIVEVETNGTQLPNDVTLQAVSQFNVSPKLAHGGDRFSARIKLDVLKDLRDTGRAVFKFVVREVSDLDEVDEIAISAGIPPDLVWIMAEGITPHEVVARTAELADHVVSRHWNLTTRLHVLAWGDKRGR